MSTEVLLTNEMSYSEAESFLAKFYAEYNEILFQMEALSQAEEPEKKLKLANDYETLSTRTVTLQKYLTENTQFIPKYETRKAQEQLARLAKISQDKRDKIFPKKKFGFKSKQKMTSLADAITTAEEEINEKNAKSAALADNDEIFYKGMFTYLILEKEEYVRYYQFPFNQ